MQLKIKNIPPVSGVKTYIDRQTFWNNLSSHDNLAVMLGSIKINQNVNNYSNLISSIIEDLNNIFGSSEIYFKLFNDIDHNDQSQLHFMVIFFKDDFVKFERSVLYSISVLNQVDKNIINQRQLIDHYLEYHDIYEYKRVSTHTLGGLQCKADERRLC